MQIDVEHLYDNNDDEDEDEEVEVPPSDIEIKIKNEPEENNITDSENKIWTHRTIPLKSRMNANYNNYKNIKQTQRGRNQIRKAQRNLNISGSIYANRNAHHRRRRPFIPHQKTQNQRKFKKYTVNGKQRAYLNQLRRLRNSQGFFLLGQTSAQRFFSSTPNDSLICPLTRNSLNQFNSFCGTRAKNYGFGSSASCASANSMNSRKSASRRTVRSFRSNVSNHSSVLDPQLAEEIAHIQSYLAKAPDHDELVLQNRRPVENVKTASTNQSLTSRFSNYYLPNNK
ncbi:uncharacterized protein isoform X2 [Rhodnius prolixus]